MFLRAISVAIFHPLSRKGRKKTLHNILNENTINDDSKPYKIYASKSVKSENLNDNRSIRGKNDFEDNLLMKLGHKQSSYFDLKNPYREGFEYLFQCSNVRLELLGLMLLYYQSDRLTDYEEFEKYDSKYDSESDNENEVIEYHNGQEVKQSKERKKNSICYQVEVEVGEKSPFCVKADRHLSHKGVIQGEDQGGNKNGGRDTNGNRDGNTNGSGSVCVLEVPSVKAVMVLRALDLLPTHTSHTGERERIDEESRAPVSQILDPDSRNSDVLRTDNSNREGYSAVADGPDKNMDKGSGSDFSQMTESEIAMTSGGVMPLPLTVPLTSPLSSLLSSPFDLHLSSPSSSPLSPLSTTLSPLSPSTFNTIPRTPLPSHDSKKIVVIIREKESEEMREQDVVVEAEINESSDHKSVTNCNEQGGSNGEDVSSGTDVVSDSGKSMDVNMDDISAARREEGVRVTLDYTDGMMRPVTGDRIIDKNGNHCSSSNDDNSDNNYFDKNGHQETDKYNTQNIKTNNPLTSLPSQDDYNAIAHTTRNKGAIQVIKEEIDDIECVSEERGLSSLEPDVMSIYKLCSIAEYSSHRKKEECSLTNQNAEFDRKINVDEKYGNGAETVVASSIGYTFFVDHELVPSVDSVTLFKEEKESESTDEDKIENGNKLRKEKYIASIVDDSNNSSQKCNIEYKSDSNIGTGIHSSNKNRAMSSNLTNSKKNTDNTILNRVLYSLIENYQSHTLAAIMVNQLSRYLYYFIMNFVIAVTHLFPVRFLCVSA